MSVGSLFLGLVSCICDAKAVGRHKVHKTHTKTYDFVVLYDFFCYSLNTDEFNKNKRCFACMSRQGNTRASFKKVIPKNLEILPCRFFAMFMCCLVRAGHI